MFDNIQVAFTTYPDGTHRTEAFLTLDEEGLKYVVDFTLRSDFYDRPGVQLLTRVFAIPAPRMLGRKTPRHWADSMRWDIVRANQHLPIALETA